MKVFISADIEGITTTTYNSDCTKGDPYYQYHCEQMTSEVLAACDGAIAAGATEILIKDAHSLATNIDLKRLPKCARIIRNKADHPYGMAAAHAGVPTVYLAGDKGLCEDYKDLHPKLITTAVKDGRGASTISLAPARALELIREDSERALRQDLTNALTKIPDQCCVDICYNRPEDAYKFSFYPGMKQIDDTTIRLETDDYFEVLRAFRFVQASKRI